MTLNLTDSLPDLSPDRLNFKQPMPNSIFEITDVVQQIESHTLAKLKAEVNPVTFLEISFLRTEFWAHNQDLYYELEHFYHVSHSLILKVIRASINRKMFSDRPVLREQNSDEHIAHMLDHLVFWTEANPGDELSVDEQAQHFVCRALLAYYTYLVEQHPNCNFNLTI